MDPYVDISGNRRSGDLHCIVSGGFQNSFEGLKKHGRCTHHFLINETDFTIEIILE